MGEGDNTKQDDQWKCNVCGKSVDKKGARGHFDSKHKDIINQYEEQYGKDDAWAAIKRDGYLDGPDPNLIELENKNKGGGSPPSSDPLTKDDEEFQQIELDGRKYTPKN